MSKIQKTYSVGVKIVNIQMSVLVFWAVFNVVSAGSIKFIYDATLDGPLCLNSDVVFKEKYPSKNTCSAECARKPSCRTIFYKPSTNECRGCSKSYIKGDTLDVFEDVYVYTGCYVDSEDRILSDVITSSRNMTTKICYEFCISHGKRLMLLEGALECFCGNQLKIAVKAPENDCWYPCAGDSTEKCGGDWRGSVYDTL